MGEFQKEYDKFRKLERRYYKLVKKIKEGKGEELERLKKEKEELAERLYKFWFKYDKPAG